MISKDKIETMRRAFKSYDRDGNGVLDKDEIYDLLTNHFKEQGPFEENQVKFYINQLIYAVREMH